MRYLSQLQHPPFLKFGKHYLRGRIIAPKVLLPGMGGEGWGKDTLRQNQLLPWLEWTTA
jgi:hypothetical protein